jgi:protein SCO1/2
VISSNRYVRWTLWSFLILMLGGVIVWFAYRSLKASEQHGFSNLPKLYTTPAFALTDQDGKPFSSEQLKGHIWLADFIFTECPGPCPLLSGRFQELHQMLIRTPEVKLVSFSVDPETDTPPVLKAYGQKFFADTTRWFFLTGSEEVVRALIINQFLLPLTPNPGGKKNPDGAFMHSTKVVLVDPDGQVRALYEGLQNETLQKILIDVGALEREFKHGN